MKGGGVSFIYPRSAPAPKVTEMDPSGTVAGCTGPMPIDLCADKGRTSADERGKRFVHGRCL
jgi:hypothetical protein